MEGTGQLSVRTARDGDRVLVEIGDNGPGIPEAAAHILEPFYTTKPVGKGTGPFGLEVPGWPLLGVTFEMEPSLWPTIGVGIQVGGCWSRRTRGRRSCQITRCSGRRPAVRGCCGVVWVGCCRAWRGVRRRRLLGWTVPPLEVRLRLDRIGRLLVAYGRGGQ
jgi:hypothetical protein